MERLQAAPRVVNLRFERAPVSGSSVASSMGGRSDSVDGPKMLTEIQAFHGGQLAAHPGADSAGTSPVASVINSRRLLLSSLLLSICALGHGSAIPAAADAPAACVDVDSGTAKDLESLKGVGPVLSKRIIDYRKNERTAATKDGRKTWNFGNWATLMKVEGVSQQICSNNIDKVCFNGKVQKACPVP